ncbi:ketoacyl-synt-domain-containing protein [Dothidotthia symphoricarpi CBS 119687]|uniref:Ketoacyl-synt-domain-containing protein n=1 Tax=Dothidotthia symphoricarpi CBS 119687 TaxID=1392245 RepID=A0A6A6AS14_9PLEO|nr:ketoacyl-synt-domain-containing protein [Dothidotthia symphoricarpi CBS 119687]KAF2133637.1 ketoacyl-synt-domain-containing protein [Dothidotthia symphoricarpi CBS 119687]
MANPCTTTFCSDQPHDGCKKHQFPTTYIKSEVGETMPGPTQPTCVASKMAIIGYSGRYPSAQSNEEFWSILVDGRDVATKVPKARWDINTHVDPSGERKNTSAVPFGCWLKDPGLFDAPFFNMSPREAPYVDPAQRLSLTTAYEALECAGLVPGSTPSTQRDRIGVFYGTASNDYGEANSSQHIEPYSIPGACRAFIPGRQSYFFKFSGPSYSVDTACASSLSTIHLACNALRLKDIDTAVVGGTNIITNPDVTVGLDRGHFLSRTGNCKTFDEDADGYCRGEGVVTFVIKRYEDAVADNDPIIALILASATNHSAEAESMTRPHVATQCANIEKVLLRANVDPDSVRYVEMHGTGTQIGDAREMETVLTTFARGTREIPRADPLYLGSAKANIGHGESVSGSIALAKVLMMLEKETIVPHIGIKTKMNRKIPGDLEQRNVHIPKSSVAWPQSIENPRRAVVNNFSAAGGNSTILIEDAPPRNPSTQRDPRTSFVVAVSAKSSTGLAANIRSLVEYMKKENPDLASLSYTSTARRMHHSFRVAVCGSSISDVCEQLERRLIPDGVTKSIDAVKSAPDIAFAFTGQGSQYFGMGRDLLNFQSFAQDMHRLDTLCQKLGFPAVLPFIQADSNAMFEPSPVVVQLALTCLQIAMARLWQSWGVQPTAVVGHSLGEYAALCVAGVLSESDVVWLVGKRALLLQDKCTPNTHSMIAVDAAWENISMLDLDAFRVEIACKNSPNQIVLSGANADVATVQDILSEAHISCTRLDVPLAFHSAQVAPILDELMVIAGSVEYKAPRIPVLSPLLGEVVVEAGVFGPAYLARHCRETVNFTGAIRANHTLTDSTAWVEIGPHPVLSGFLHSTLASAVTVAALHRHEDAWSSTGKALATLYTSGVDVQWAAYQSDFIGHASVLRLPSYSWDLKEYWIPYENDWRLHKGGLCVTPNAAAPSSTPEKLPNNAPRDEGKSKKRPRPTQAHQHHVKKQRMSLPSTSASPNPTRITIQLDMKTMKLEVDIDTGRAALKPRRPRRTPDRKALSPATPQPEPTLHNSTSRDRSWSHALNIMSEASGVPTCALTDAVVLADVGFDSLLAMTCSERFRKECGVECPTSVFFEYPTVGGLKAFWVEGRAEKYADCPNDSDSTAVVSDRDGYFSDRGSESSGLSSSDFHSDCD